jgi:hypothetical protein
MDTSNIEKEYLRQLQDERQQSEDRVNKTFNWAIGLVVLLPWLRILSSKKKAIPAPDKPGPPGKPFRFKDYPFIEREVNGIMSGFRESMHDNISAGIRKGWEVGNYKNDKIVDEYFRNVKLSPELTAKFKQKNINTLDSYIEKNKGGMNLSKRVWNLTNQFKKELEMHVGQGIANGDTPHKIGQRIKRYLNNPETAERGKGLELLKKTHPGQGVYRSAKKNAERLVNNEIQIAYRQSNWERWQQQDFIIGQYIRVSASHHIIDICDDVQGAYPKWFMFTGWHVSCHCICMAITAKDWTPDMPDQQIMELPKGFNEWVTDNSDRIEGWKNKPYFIRDNKKVVDKIIKEKK